MLDLVSILTILAILVGPIVAVRITRLSDKEQEANGRRLAIFKTLMATRATWLSNAHVEALNSIDIEFNGDKAGDKEIVAAWKNYLDALSPGAIGAERHQDLFGDLLQKMGKALGYDFDINHIKNSAYYPKGYANIENDNTEIRLGLKELLQCKRAIPLYEASKSHDPQGIAPMPKRGESPESGEAR